MKKPDMRSGFFVFAMCLSGSDERGLAGKGLAALHVAESLANDLFGQAGTFAALGANTEIFADITVAAAAFIDCIADLTVGDTLAEANVHGQSRKAGCCWRGILMLMRMLVKTL